MVSTAEVKKLYFGENVKFSLYFSDERRLIQQGRESVYFKN